ncbi:MAG TPA: T9SS type A sorting domain-containing protein [Edaphocola sp.]|nr:T9SS type A sorting domain-containing protein [Edaphocola sp.]
MKKNPLLLLILAISLSTNFESLSQTSYRVNSFYYKSYDGSQFVKDGDSSRLYFRGEHSYKDVLFGYDVPDFILLFSGTDYIIQQFPEQQSTLLGIDSTLSFELNGAGTEYSDLFSRSTSSLNANGNIGEIISRSKTGGTWENDLKEVYDYDAQGKIIKKTSIDWISGAWENKSKEVSQYDAQGNLTEFSSYDWVSGAWNNDRKYIYEYDANKNCTSSIYLIGSGSNWDNSEKTIITYNSNNKATNQLFLDWNSSTWEPDRQIVISYNGNNTVHSILTQDYTGGNWEDNEKFTYTYNGNKKKDLTYEEYDGTVWNKNYKMNYYYTNNNMDTLIGQGWDNGGSSWKNDKRYILEYNSNNLATTLTNDFWQVGDYWDKTTSSSKYYFFYESFSGTGINQVQLLSRFNIYPNPASEYLNIEIDWKQPKGNATLTITDITGKTHHNQTIKQSLQSKDKIDISNLPSGIYNLTISTNEANISKQFQIMK